MSDALIEAVRDGWGWTGVRPAAVTTVSAFGHLIVQDEENGFWYLDPEIGKCERVACGKAELASYMARPDVREVWEAELLVEAARARLGEPAPGWCYTLAPLALLQGDYSHKNLITLPISELITFTGDVGRQIKELPDGATFRIEVTD